jgi:hypothetical protein
MTPRRSLAPAALAAALALTLAACGGSDESNDSASSQPTASAADFPQPKGRTMSQIQRSLSPGPVLAPTIAVLEPGENRFGFGLFDRARKQISEAAVALYVQRSGSTKTTGPFLARDLPLVVAPPFQSETVAKDPDAAKSLYVAEATFEKPGLYAVLAVAKLDGRLVSSEPIGVRVTKDAAVPDVGEPAPKIYTPTEDDVGGDLAEIDTRTPHDSMHEANFADVVGKKPAVLLFATPALCQSRVCGPVVDIAEEVKAEVGDKAEFIHMEVYRDNMIAPGCLEGTRPAEECHRPQMLEFGLPSEPWLFAIDSSGKVAARLEGAYSKGELEEAVQKAISG